MSNNTSAGETSPLLNTTTTTTNPSDHGTIPHGTAPADDIDIDIDTATGNDLTRHPSTTSHRTAQYAGHPATLPRLPYIVPAVSIGIFLAAADQTIAITTYGKIGSDLHALQLTSFVSTAYFLTLTSFQPLYGRLSDVFGRRRCLLVAYGIFGLGGLLCGLARDMYQLIAARAFQGVGGGGMTVVVSVLFSDIVPLKDRGMWQGFLNIIYAVGASSGAPLGGILSDALSWRWAFLVQAPLCLLAFVAVFFVLRDPTQEAVTGSAGEDGPDTTPKDDEDDRRADTWRRRVRRIDFLGAFTLVLAVTALLVGLDRGSNTRWSSPASYMPLALSAVFSAALLLVETRVASEPIAPAHIVFDRALLAPYLCNFFSFGGYLAVLYYLPLLWQAVDGLSATDAALRLLPSILTGVSGSLFAGFYMRRTGKYYTLTVLVYGLLTVGVMIVVVASSGLVWSYSTVLVIIGTMCCSFGNGNGVTSTLIALISNAAPADQAVATACSYLFRSLGSVVGISLSASVIQQVLKKTLNDKLGSGTEAKEIEQKVRQSLDYLKELDPATRMIVRDAYSKAVVDGFVLMLIIVSGAFVASFFIREKKLSK